MNASKRCHELILGLRNFKKLLGVQPYRVLYSLASTSTKTLLRHWTILLQLIKLPVARLRFHRQIDPDDIGAAYRSFTKRHPRYKVIRHKTMGAALIDLRDFAARSNYLDQIKGKNCGAYHAKRARARGYVLAEIDRNRYIDQIYAINTSLETRQGRPMDPHYQQKQTRFDSLKHFTYYGILNAEGQLMAYANLGVYGNFAAFSQLIGQRNNDGIMHLLVVEIVCRLIDEGTVQYLMYDTFFGAQPGMRQFKQILGFRPYRARYSLE
jgi:hypothetical protein